MSHPLPELARQHANYKAVRARILGARCPSERAAREERQRFAIEFIRARIKIPPPEPPIPFGYKATDIIRCVSKTMGITREEMVSTKRSPHFVNARHIAAYFIRIKRGLSMPQIGAILGGRDHSSVFHGLNCIANERERYEPWISRVERKLAKSAPRETPQPAVVLP